MKNFSLYNNNITTTTTTTTTTTATATTTTITTTVTTTTTTTPTNNNNNMYVASYLVRAEIVDYTRKGCVPPKRHCNIWYRFCEIWIVCQYCKTNFTYNLTNVSINNSKLYL